MMRAPPLDIDAVRAFVFIVDLGGFTRAAEALGRPQAAVSLKIQRLEKQLGQRLLERTPRFVTLSRHGAAFVDQARALLDIHDRALSSVRQTTAIRKLAIGLSEHVIGANAAALLARVKAFDPFLRLEAHIGASRQLTQDFDQRRLEALIVRFAEEGDGPPLFEDSFGWFAAADVTLVADEPIPLVLLAAPCMLRDAVVPLLAQAGRTWREAFIGGGFMAIAAAVSAGLGVAPMARRLAPKDAVEWIKDMPLLPASPVLARHRIADPQTLATFRFLCAALHP